MIKGVMGQVACFHFSKVPHKINSCYPETDTRSRFPTVPNQGQDRDGICRSWGQHHYETFDGIYFYVPGSCSYILAQDCHSATPQYTVWVRSNLDTEMFKVYDICCFILLFFCIL